MSDDKAALRAWLNSVIERLEPSRVDFQSGETLADVVQRVLSEEETRVRDGNDALTDMKLLMLAEMKKQFG